MTEGRPFCRPILVLLGADQPEIYLDFIRKLEYRGGIQCDRARVTLPPFLTPSRVHTEEHLVPEETVSNNDIHKRVRHSCSILAHDAMDASTEEVPIQLDGGASALAPSKPTVVVTTLAPGPTIEHVTAVEQRYVPIIRRA